MSQSNRGNTTERNKLRAACFRVWGTTCMYCGAKATEVDHILELARGGENTIDNVQPLCKDCHKHKTIAFNSTRRASHKAVGVFSGAFAPTDSLGTVSPQMTRFDPPTAI